MSVHSLCINILMPVTTMGTGGYLPYVNSTLLLGSSNDVASILCALALETIFTSGVLSQICTMSSWEEVNFSSICGPPW